MTHRPGVVLPFSPSSPPHSSPFDLPPPFLLSLLTSPPPPLSRYVEQLMVVVAGSAGILCSRELNKLHCVRTACFFHDNFMVLRSGETEGILLVRVYCLHAGSVCSEKPGDECLIADDSHRGRVRRRVGYLPDHGTFFLSLDSRATQSSQCMSVISLFFFMGPLYYKWNSETDKTLNIFGNSPALMQTVFQKLPGSFLFKRLFFMNVT